ncbi:MAG: helix-turn-helix domain-containing protein [Candidatus Heimdallarchaeota archaeon]
MSFFTKSVQELETADIQFLIDNEVRETVQLEFKKTMSFNNNSKRMLCRHVSALANSQGGYLIIGITEDDGVAKEIIGIPKMFGVTKTEEWIEQVLISNIAQRVAPLIMKVIDIETDPDNMVLVIYVPLSPRAPHMVTFHGENRYYVRHNTLTARAEEFEIRDIFVRSENMYNRTMRYLEALNYVDPESPTFGENRWTRNLELIFVNGMTRGFHHANSFYTFLCLPLVLSGNIIETTNAQLLQWLDRNERRYPPRQNDIFLPGLYSTTFEGLVLPEHTEGRNIARYLLINRNGHIEYGSTGGIIMEGPTTSFSINRIRDEYEMFLRFVCDLFDHQSVHYSGSIRIIFNVIRLNNLVPFEWKKSGLGLIGPFYPSPNIQLLEEATVFELSERIRTIVSYAHLRLSNAFGFKSPPQS